MYCVVSINAIFSIPRHHLLPIGNNYCQDIPDILKRLDPCVSGAAKTSAVHLKMSAHGLAHLRHRGFAVFLESWSAIVARFLYVKALSIHILIYASMYLSECFR